MASLLGIVVGAASGLASALFLLALEWATDEQTNNPWLLYLLPFAGVLIAWSYAGWGKAAAGGNNLLLDQIHAAGGSNRVPLHMFPLVLGATILTHLFGGSAGREGTAVQMGGAIAGWLSRVLNVTGQHLRVMLMCGISGGFSSVFGTPLAGTVFGMEVVAMGGMRYDALIPCLIAAVVGDLVVRTVGVHHATYVVSAGFPEISAETVVPVVLAGIAFGLASLLFSEATATIEHVAKHLVPRPVWRTFLGGFVVILITLVYGTRAYNGLSLPLLADCFNGEAVPTFAFMLKLVLTAVTLGVGFKGGEVTPLFVIGATLGVTLSGPLGLEPDTLAALGFVAVFAAAANTPIACVIMGAEIFGGSGIVFFGIAVFVAYTISGDRGIYHSQRILTSKHLRVDSASVGGSLADARRTRAPVLGRAQRRLTRNGNGANEREREET
ncbi:MAG: chloride channel protein [Thermomicrobiales bacterium]|nr:chloride channel protein [Thermomicrobiales bacterium]MCO5222713.1 chloride channel protein [Thermomicrobiales bacterium]